MASTLSRFADFSSSSAAGIPLGSPYVENEIEAGCDGCFRYSHHQIAAAARRERIV